MKRVIWICIILLLSIRSHAQEETTEPEEITGVKVSYFNAASDDIVTLFFSALETQLTSNDLTLEIVELETGDPMMHVLFRPLSPRGGLAQSEDATAYVLNLLDSPFEQPALATILTDQAVIVSAPPEVSAQLTTALLLFVIGRCDEATTEMLIGLHGAVENPLWENQLNFYLGNCAIMNEEYEDALAYFALTQNDALGMPYWSTAINMSFVYIMMEEPETGFQLMEEVIAVLPPWAPDIADVYTRRAMLYALVGNHEAALTDFETALTQNPGFAPCFYYRGLYYADRGEIESARADLTHYLELQPDGKFAEEATEYLENL